MSTWRCKPCGFQGERELWPVRKVASVPEPHVKVLDSFGLLMTCPKCNGRLVIAMAPDPLAEEAFAIHRARLALVCKIVWRVVRMPAQKIVDEQQARADSAFVDSALHEIYGGTAPHERPPDNVAPPKRSDAN